MVICCIGTPKILGDSLAPKVGDTLLSLNINAFVYGTTARPITALNYNDYFEHISTKHKNDFVVAIDCALGKKENIGIIKINKNGISPGKAIGRSFEKIGNIGILGQVGDILKTPIDELKNADQNILDNLVKNIVFLVLNIYDFFILYNKKLLKN